MRKSFLLFVALFAFTTLSFGQEGLKAAKKAGRNLSTYNLDPGANQDKLDKALELIETAFQSEEVKNDAKSYIVKGDIYSTVSNNVVTTAYLAGAQEADPNAPSPVADADMSYAYKAVDAYKMAYEMAEKNFIKKDAIKGMVKLESIIENLGIVAYQNNKWADAYNNFTGALALSDFLGSNGETSILDDAKKSEIMVNAISVGAQEGSGVDYTPLLEKAIESGVDNSSLYQVAYQTFEKTDKDKAIMYLNKGVERYPNDPGLLFAQINYFIGEGRLEELIDKLKAAITAEPDNASVYSTLGNVYDQLYVKESDAGNDAKAEEYFNGALEYYGKATEIDDKAYNAYYGIGALYFNKAAKVGKELNELSSDLSAAGMKKYDARKGDMMNLYEQSYPYLESAEKLNPNDPLVLQAMREYYARTGNLEKANEYKAKMEAATGGGN